MVKGAESRPGIGRPIANSEMMILDQWLRPLPPGVVGEMYIASVNVARHYHNAPRLTAERFVPGRLRSPSGGDRLFRTGDLGYQDSDGNIFFVGRSNTQVKLKGYRIELDEVRYAFLQHPSVSDAVVALSGGDEEKSLIAWIVANEKPDPAELREYVGRTIPGYMVPSQVIPIEAVPLTKNGKVDYAALPRLASEVSTELTAKPEGMVATELFNIWKEVLKRKEIGMTHDFLQSGGDSILLLQLQLKIQSRFGIDVSLGRLAVNSSLEKMSRYLQDLLDQKSPSAIASGVPDPVANSARIGS